MQFKHIAGGVIASFLVAACASPTQNLQPLSSNTQIQIKTPSGKLLHSGPTSLPVSLNNPDVNKQVYMVTFNQQGFDAKQFQFNAVNQSLYFGTHELTNNSQTLVIDPVTGALFKAKPELNRKLGALDSGNMRIMSLHDLPTPYRRELSAL